MTPALTRSVAEDRQTVASLGNQSIMGYAIKDEPTLKRVEDFKSGEQLGIAVRQGQHRPAGRRSTAPSSASSDDGSMAKFKDTWFGPGN